MARLRSVLDAFLERSDHAALARGDPIELVQTYQDPEDREVAGLIVAALAYGRVQSIKNGAGTVLDVLGRHPARAIRRVQTRRRLTGFVYRFQRGEDLPNFLEALAGVRRTHGSLGALFASCAQEADEDYVGAMGRFVDSIRGQVKGRTTRGLEFLLPSVAKDGGCAKRLCLYVRWMVRSDLADLGVWNELLGRGHVVPSKLVVPLDTHVARIAQYIGLTKRRSATMPMALDVTRSLKQLRPEDPLYYDMALCHLGISGSCPKKRDFTKCQGCPIAAVCQLGKTPSNWPPSPPPPYN